MNKFAYVEPSSLNEMAALLSQYGSSAAILAGGTDLINHINHAKRSPDLVVSLRRIAELSSNVSERTDGVEIGALTTLTTVAEQPLICEKFTALAEAAVKVGSKQIRNRGTVVGNVCNASPAADTVTALLLYDAVINISGGQANKRSTSIFDFILGPGQTTLEVGEMVESIFLPFPSPTAASAYLKLSRRAGVDLATVGVAVAIDADRNARIALGAVGPKAFRACQAEKILQGNPLHEGHLQEAIAAAREQANPISDLRASKEYRLAMIDSLLRIAVRTVVERTTLLKG